MTENLYDLIRRAVREGWYSPEAVAAEFNNIAITEVTPKQRAAIKAIAYPILYGRSL